MATTDFDRLERLVLGITPDTPQAELLLLRDQLEWQASKLRELRSLLNDQMIEWINANGAIELPDQNLRYYVGTKKTTKCIDKGLALQCCIENAGTNDELVDMFASNPFKHGAVKRLIGDEAFGQCFEVVTVDDVKTGKPKKEVKKVDTRYGG